MCTIERREEHCHRASSKTGQIGGASRCVSSAFVGLLDYHNPERYFFVADPGVNHENLFVDSLVSVLDGRLPRTGCATACRRQF